MKLSSISTEADPRPLQVRFICGGPTLLSEAIKGNNSPPLSYLFIESVSATNVLDEAGEGRLGALLKAGMAKLNAALTPGNASDLDTLLTFQAPNGGGAKAVGDLVKQASRSNASILDDQNWWNGLFNAFGVADDTVKSNIINQVKQDMGPATPNQPPQGQDPLDDSPQSEAPPEGSPPPSGPPQGGPANQGPIGSGIGSAGAGTVPGSSGLPPQGGTDREALLAALRAERDSEQGYQNDIMAQLAEIRKQREANRADIGHLKNKLEKMRAQGPKGTSESICNEIALGLLNEDGVQANLNAVCGYMLRKMANNTAIRGLQAPTIKEAGLGDRLRGAFRGVGNFLANPEYAKRKLSGVTDSANNERAAKLAVQALTDHVRTSFEAKLQEGGITPDQIASKMKTWADLKTLYEQNPSNPKVVDAFVAASNEMKQIFQLFQTGSSTPFDVEQPVEAEVVQPDMPEKDADPLQPSPDAITNQQSAQPVLGGPQPEPEPEPEPQPEHPKAEFMRGAFQAMYQAALDAGRAAQGQDPTTLYNTIKAAAQQAAQPYARQDLEATNVAYRYLVEKLKEAYRTQFNQQESLVERFGKILTEDAPWRRKGMRLSMIGQ